MSYTKEQIRAYMFPYSCEEYATDEEDRLWVCFAPENHAGGCFLDQVAGPAYDPGDYGGNST